MARLFVSYARSDMPVVAQLVSELREMGHEPFYDQDLTGGQRWWDVLLQRIEDSDGFLPVLSEAYIDSEACRLESQWAYDTGVPILPLDLGSVGPEMCDPQVAQTNWIRYGLEDRSSIARLARALGALPPRTPPAEPPVRPPVPVTYLTATRQEIHGAEMLSVERQLAIIATLRTKLGTEDDASARTLLTELRRRPDVAYASAVEIDHMLGAEPRPASEPSRRAPKESPGPGRRTLVAAAAAAAVLVIALGTSWAFTHLGGDDGGEGGDGGASPALGPGPDESMSESNPPSGSPESTSSTANLMAILRFADESSTNHLLPPGSCAPVSADEVKCTSPAKAVISVDLRLYDSTQELYDAYVDMAEDVSGMPFDDNYADCNMQYSSGEVSWNHNQRHSRRYSVEQLIMGDLDEDTQAAGRVFCDTHDNVQTLVWTQNPSLLAVVRGAPPDPVKAWWRQVHHSIACIGPDGADICGDMGDMDGDAGGGDPSGDMSGDPSGDMSDGMG